MRIVLLLTVFASLAVKCTSSPRTPAFPKTSASPRTTAPPTARSPFGPAALPGIVPAVIAVAPFIPIPLYSPGMQSFPSATIKPSPETVASSKTKVFPKTATSPQTRMTATSGRTVSSTTTAVSRKNGESLWTKSATKETKSPRTTSSAKTTTSTAIETTKQQKLIKRQDKECDFVLLNANSKDLKNLWDEAMKAWHPEVTTGLSYLRIGLVFRNFATIALFSKTNDTRNLLRKIIELYNMCTEVVDIDFERQWEIYLKIFGKEYDATEKEMRKEMLKRSTKEVKEHNELYKKGRVTYRATLNHLSDRTKEELKKMNGFRASNATVHGRPKRNARLSDEIISRYYYSDANFTAPASSDWRTKGKYVTPVTNQGDCGSCYAFAGIGALEAYHKKNDGELVKLSVQNILDCTWHLGNNGCVFRYARSVGVVSSFHYPYTMNASRNCHWRHEHVVANNRGYYDVQRDSELALQSAVATHGPVAASIGTRGLKKYRSGVFSPDDCGAVTHGVLVVGYGTDPRHGDYWIVKNFWGFWWGEDGYFRIARNRNNMCNIASYALFPY